MRLRTVAGSAALLLLAGLAVLPTTAAADPVDPVDPVTTDDPGVAVVEYGDDTELAPPSPRSRIAPRAAGPRHVDIAVMTPAGATDDTFDAYGAAEALADVEQMLAYWSEMTDGATGDLELPDETDVWVTTTTTECGPSGATAPIRPLWDEAAEHFGHVDETGAGDRLSYGRRTTTSWCSVRGDATTSASRPSTGTRRARSTVARSTWP